MSQLNQLKDILYRKVKINVMDKKPNPRLLDINLGEISRGMGCSVKDVECLLQHLKSEKEIKTLIPNAFSKEEYSLTIPENSSILNR